MAEEKDSGIPEDVEKSFYQRLTGDDLMKEAQVEILKSSLLQRIRALSVMNDNSGFTFKFLTRISGIRPRDARFNAFTDAFMRLVDEGTILLMKKNGHVMFDEHHEPVYQLIVN